MAKKKSTVNLQDVNLEDFSEIETLAELRESDENPYSEMEDGYDKLDLESELFNLIYANNNNVDGGKQEVKVMTKTQATKPAPVADVKP